jgi:hypothetical protein
VPAQIWKSFMTQATAGQPVLPLPGTGGMESDVPSGASPTSAFDDLLSRLLEDKASSGDQN